MMLDPVEVFDPITQQYVTRDRKDTKIIWAQDSEGITTRVDISDPTYVHYMSKIYSTDGSMGAFYGTHEYRELPEATVGQYEICLNDPYLPICECIFSDQCTTVGGWVTPTNFVIPVSPVPLPAAMWLFVTGIVALVLIARRGKKDA